MDLVVTQMGSSDYHHSSQALGAPAVVATQVTLSLSLSLSVFFSISLSKSIYLYIDLLNILLLSLDLYTNLINLSD